MVSVRDVLELVQVDHVAALRELEDTTKRAASRQLAADLARLERTATKLWVVAFGSIEAEGSGLALAALLARLRFGVRSAYRGTATTATAAILAALEDALTLGVDQARELAPRAGRDRSMRPELGTIRESLRDVRSTLRDQLNTATRLLEVPAMQGGSFAQLLAALAKARGGVARIEAASDHAVESARAAGSAAYADAHGMGRLWIAERDGCLTCTAYSGRIAVPDQDFPAGLSFGKRSTVKEALRHPPAHPHCRCALMPWSGTPWRGKPDDLPDALKREARRSVLRGWSLESESNKARLDAAERLLGRGARLPKTVEAEARRAVRRGKFRSRRVPSGQSGTR